MLVDMTPPRVVFAIAGNAQAEVEACPSTKIATKGLKKMEQGRGRAAKAQHGG